MFLRKLLVIVVPLVLCGLCVFFLPLLGGFGLWSDLLQGLILGALLALLLPLSGASRRKEPFATLLVVPMIALIVLLALQLMRALGVALPFQPVSGCTIDGASQAEEKAIRFFSRFFHALLTNLHDKCIIHFDKDVCHQGKQICQTEVLYGTAKSLEGVPGNAECQSAGNGALVRRIAADNQPD